VGRVRRLGIGYAAITPIRALAGLNLASRRKFCAVAARRNSSLAPHGRLSRKRPSRRMRLRWANSISIFFRRRQAASYSGVEARARATSRASSCRSRGILRAIAFGQQRDLVSQTSQSFLLIDLITSDRDPCRSLPCRPTFGLGGGLNHDATKTGER
jgi:hypothetical protein